MQEVLTIPEVAKFLRITEWQARVLTKRGEIRGFKVGTHWRIFRSELERFCSPTPSVIPSEGIARD